MNLHFPVTLRASTIAGCLAAILLLAGPSLAQEEFILRDGKRLPAASVKPAVNGFSATVVTGANAQNINFAAKDVLRANLREPSELGEARTLIANGKPLPAITLLTAAEETLRPFKQIPGTWWHRALLLRMDALASKGEPEKGAGLVTADVLADLPEASAAQLKDFQSIIAKPTVSADVKITALQELAKRTDDPWIAARAWIEVGSTLSDQGKIEDAVKAWIRAAVFHPAERDLAARATILAARGLQQINLPKDGLKLLDDYLKDQIASPYEEAIKTEAARIDPKRETSETPKTEPTENSN